VTDKDVLTETPEARYLRYFDEYWQSDREAVLDVLFEAAKHSAEVRDLHERAKEGRRQLYGGERPVKPAAGSGPV
jgi:hypothetical protein